LPRVHRITQRPQCNGSNQYKPKAWGLYRIAIAWFELVSTVCVELHQAQTRMLDVRSSRTLETCCNLERVGFSENQPVPLSHTIVPTVGQLRVPGLDRGPDLPLHVTRPRAKIVYLWASDTISVLKTRAQAPPHLADADERPFVLRGVNGAGAPPADQPPRPDHQKLAASTMATGATKVHAPAAARQFTPRGRDHGAGPTAKPEADAVLLNLEAKRDDLAPPPRDATVADAPEPIQAQVREVLDPRPDAGRGSATRDVFHR
jgi:hypothetical protein